LPIWVDGACQTTGDVNASNQVFNVSTNGVPTSYLFDTRGNLKSKGTQNFGFDLGNRLISSPGGNYAYDGLGRRTKIASSDSSTRIQVYSQAGQLLWATSTGGPRPASTTAYIYLAGKQIAETNSVSGTQYVHTDALGSPVAHSSSANPAVVINRSRFEPYGYVAQGTKPSANTSVVGFTGHVQDAETDLVYMQQRYYDPIAGRFLSVDPVVTDASSGKSFGRYYYAKNNPYSYVDTDGRWATWVHYRITYTAAIQSGMTKEQAKAAAEKVVGVDKGTQSSRASDTNIHAMAGQLPDGSWQTKEQAIDATNRYIKNGDNPLENRMHAAQDATADHHLGQVWRDPLTTEGKDVVSIVKDVISAIVHLVDDVFPSKEAEAKAVEETKKLLTEKKE